VVNLGPDQSILFNSTGTLSASVTPSGPSYQFQWSPANLVLNPTVNPTNTLPLQSATSFICTVTDPASGCNAQDMVLINVTGTQLQFTVQLNQDTICVNDSIYAEVQATGGTGNYVYSWMSSGGAIYQGSILSIPLSSDDTFTMQLSDGVTDTTFQFSVTVISINQPIITFNGAELSTSGNVEYQWFLDGNAISNANDSTLIPGSNGVYTVCASVNGLCETCSDPFVYVSSLMNQQPNPEIHPNPFKDHIQITNLDLKYENLQVFDASGRLLHQEFMNNTPSLSIDASSWAEGLYYFTLTDKSGRTSAKKMLKSN
jgi:hypothetical protein